MPLPDLQAIYRRESADPTVMVADGQNVTVTIRNKQLRITDGVTSQRRERIISRSPKTISRLVILGTTGYITLEAFRFCADEGIAVSQLDNDGRIIASSPGKATSLAILRSQILVSTQGNTSPTGLAIVKRIIATKLTGQAEIARTMLARPDIADKIVSQSNYITNATSIDTVLGYEGKAATIYWSAWQNVTVPFSPTDLTKVPARWLTFNGRTSTPGATDPINAMLNYAYRLAESEATHACNINALDPAIGFMHAIRDGRDGMALDLMECIRPICDWIVLNLLDYGQGIPFDSRNRPKYFPANWTYELRHGITRLFAPLTHVLAEHCAELAESLAPVAADVVKLLRSADLTPSIPVGQANGGHVPSAGVAHVRRYAPPRSAGRPFRDTTMPAPSCAADVIPDEAWRLISHQIPTKTDKRGGARRLDDRVVIAGIVWCAANNLPTTRCPETLDVSGHTLYQRRKRWIESGDWPHIVRAITRTVLPGYKGN